MRLAMWDKKAGAGNNDDRRRERDKETSPLVLLSKQEVDGMKAFFAPQ
jgi:hypothetical protein